eukprot:CAMPEP_0117773564 /NCGR_PEP_ID=MMETSP0947-20121206/25925_1 /TAXON_ID=44440 /ORGANISM="Chattonella subsalsa, Strain CCMP2191" /LENGTH=65 /DNA_ID=CAMNT_0005599719 /DNA_START=572 /DNA_END=765 /DNA_ORIENTATION=+
MTPMTLFGNWTFMVVLAGAAATPAAMGCLETLENSWGWLGWLHWGWVRSNWGWGLGHSLLVPVVV